MIGLLAFIPLLAIVGVAYFTVGVLLESEDVLD